MARTSPAVKRFLLALAGGASAVRMEGQYVVTAGARTVRVEHGVVRALISAGVVVATGDVVRAGPETAAWLARQAGGDAPFRNQHGLLASTAEGAQVDLVESPLGRLAQPGPHGEVPYLLAHHVAAGERIRRLTERAQMIQRTTMSYDPARVKAEGRRGPGEGPIADSAIEARRKLGQVLDTLPRDCAGVVLDVCGMLKGLQTVETERGWPRRSAKLVLRIGLDQVARELGIGEMAEVRAGGRQTGWLEQRPERLV